MAPTHAGFVWELARTYADVEAACERGGALARRLSTLAIGLPRVARKSGPKLLSLL